MGAKVKMILVGVSILALLVGGSYTLAAGIGRGESVKGEDSEGELDVILEGVNPEGPDRSDGEVEQGEQAAAGKEEPVSGVDPEGIPSPEEMDAILEGVNLGGPARSGGVGESGAGPEAGTESVIGEIGDHIPTPLEGE